MDSKQQSRGRRSYREQRAKWIPLGLFGVILLLSSTLSQAALVVADFNDLNTGSLRSQGGGIGFSDNWTNGKPTEPAPEVVAGDLTSANYSFQQSGTPQRLAIADSTPAYGLRRDLAVDFSSKFWFSFLAPPRFRNTTDGIDI
mgnify:FL=1